MSRFRNIGIPLVAAVLALGGLGNVARHGNDVRPPPSTEAHVQASEVQHVVSLARVPCVLQYIPSIIILPRKREAMSCSRIHGLWNAAVCINTPDSGAQ